MRLSNVIFGRKIDSEMTSRYATQSEMDQYEIGVKMIDFVAMEKIFGKQRFVWYLVQWVSYKRIFSSFSNFYPIILLPFRDIYKLRCVVLDSMHVALPPDIGSPLFNYCTELSLYNNLIARWRDVLDIVKFFPVLRYLNLRYQDLCGFFPHFSNFVFLRTQFNFLY